MARVEVKAIQRFLRAAGVVVDQKASKSMPILGCVKVTQAGSDLVLEVTDLEVECRERIPAVIDGGLDGACACVPFKALDSALKGRKCDSVGVRFGVAGSGPVGLDLEFNGSSLFVQGRDPDGWTGYQAPEGVEPGPIQSLPVGDLAFMLEAVSTDETRYNLNGFFLAPTELCATDGHRLHLANHRTYADCGFILPAKLAKLGVRAGKLYGVDQVDIKRRGNTVGFRIGMLVGAARLLDGEFPEYSQVIHEKQAIKIEIPDPVAWIGILEQAGRVASERTQGVKLAISRQGVTCQAENPDTGRFKAELPVSPVTCALKAPELMVGFNAQYLREGLAYLKDGPCTLSLDDDLSPGVFAQGDRTVVVMPIRI